jgi:hypothetical protein
VQVLADQMEFELVYGRMVDDPRPVMTLDFDDVLTVMNVLPPERYDNPFEVLKDGPSPFLCAVAQWLPQVAKMEVIPVIVTNRCAGDTRDLSLQWLSRYVDIEYFARIYMRPAGMTPKEGEQAKIRTIIALKSELHVDDKDIILEGVRGQGIRALQYHSQYADAPCLQALVSDTRRVLFGATGTPFKH